MRIKDGGLKIKKGLKERSGRYALCALLFAIFVCVNLRESAVKFLETDSSVLISEGRSHPAFCLILSTSSL